MDLIFSSCKLVEGWSYNLDIGKSHDIHVFALNDILLHHDLVLIEIFDQVFIKDHHLAVRATYHLINVFQSFYQSVCEGQRSFDFVDHLEKFLISNSLICKF